MPTVLIAARAYLGALKERSEFQDALAFVDTDALRAFEAIARQRAKVVVLDATFAATSRGTALMNRIKADPLLVDCDVRVIAYEDMQASTTADEPAAAAAPAPVVGLPDPSQSTPPIPTPIPTPVPTSASTPFAMLDGVELLVDGLSATLIDLSENGAQVVSTTSLKPHQRVRLTLPGSPPLLVNGEIAWAMFEMPAGGPRYRAGVAFFSPDAAKLAAFIKTNKR